MWGWGEAGGINSQGLKEEGWEWGAAPSRLSGLPEDAGAVEAAWVLAGLGIYTSWAPGSAGIAWGGGGALQAAPPCPGRILASPLNLPGAHAHMPFFMGVPKCPRPSRAPFPTSTDATSQRQ